MLDGFISDVRQTPSWTGWYEAWGSASAVTGDIVKLDWLKRITDHGAAPTITWEPWDPKAGVNQPAYRPAVIANGDFDAYINSWAYRLAAYGGPVYIRMFHELNASWYPWCAGVNGNTPEDLKAAWRHVHDLFVAAGAANVRWMWCPDAAPGNVPLPDLYPGDDVVDWIALDGYNWGTNREGSTWRSFPDIFDVAYRALTVMTGKPLAIAETACSEQGGDKAAWITDTFAMLPESYPRIRAISWFNEAVPDGDWPIYTSTRSLAAFRAAIASSSYRGRFG